MWGYSYTTTDGMIHYVIFSDSVGTPATEIVVPINLYSHVL